jgi:N6-adenosine-specific RNA methylase IME4
VTNVVDKVGTAGFMHEYCARTIRPSWYCTGSYVDLYYETSSRYGSQRAQYTGVVSYAGFFNDTSKAGLFTITGGTEDFRSAKGHVYVSHAGNSSQREMHVWY